jgi:hypothetical protein
MKSKNREKNWIETLLLLELNKAHGAEAPKDKTDEEANTN